MPADARGASGPDPADEVVDLCRDLIRIDTTNTGDTETAAGERAAAEYVAEKLAEVGLEPTIYESAPGRASVVARYAGADSSRPALLLHGHLDVVPADADEWSVHPFSGEVRDGYIWGRGAVDMKDFNAMLLAVVRQWRREGRVPPRDLVLMFLADEEAAGGYGAHFLVDEHRDVFDGVGEAVGEVGGFSVSVNNDLRLYMIETAEKGLNWMRLTVADRPGHGSMIHDDNAVTQLCEAVARLGRHRFPVELTPTVRAFLEEVSEVLGVEIDVDNPEAAIAKLGPIARIVGATIRHTANPTGLSAGYKENVIPGKASAVVDCRPLPGRVEDFERQLREVLGPDVHIEDIHRQPGVETTFDGPLVDAMAESLRHFDSGARPVPYMLSGGTDAKAFSRLGIRCFGFAPLRLPSDLDFSALFHGIDERVPVDGLRFGVRVLDRFLSRCLWGQWMSDELTTALESMIAAAREHLERVRAAEGRVDDEAVWHAYVALNNAACKYDEILRTRFDEVTPFDVEPLEVAERETPWPAPAGAEESYEPDAEPAVISVRHRRDYVVPSAAALERAAEHARAQVPDPEGDDEPVQGIGDAVLELLHAGDGTLRSLEVPELTPLDGIVVVNDVSKGLDVADTQDGAENHAFGVDAADPVIGRMDERSFYADGSSDAVNERDD